MHDAQVSLCPRKPILGTTQVALALLCSAIISGCGVPPSILYPPKAATEHSLVSRHDEIVVGIDPLISESELEQWFGSEFTKHNMTAIHLTIQNESRTRKSFILISDQILLGEPTAQVASGSQLISRDVSGRERFMAYFAVGFCSGLVGGAVLAPFVESGLHRTLARDEAWLQSRMSQLALHSDTISPGTSVSGFVYFPIDSRWSQQTHLALSIKLKSIPTNDVVSFLIDFPDDKRPFVPHK